MPTETEAAITPATLAEIVHVSTEQVFEMMLGIPVEYRGWNEKDKVPSFHGVVGMITFTGDWVGAGLLYADEEIACKLGSKMLMTEVSQVDADVLDGVGELANMILGSVKERIEPQTGPLSLSVPTVVYGKNFLARPGVQSPWVSQSFRCGHQSLEVWVSIQPV